VTATPVATTPHIAPSKTRTRSRAPKFSIPVPFGLIKFLKDHPINQLGSDPMFDPKSPAFNPVALLNVVLIHRSS